jgi:hypothetical protein
MAVGAHIPLRSRVVGQVADRTKYSNEGCRGVLLRSTVPEGVFTAGFVHGVHVMDVRRVGGHALCFFFSGGGISYSGHLPTIRRCTSASYKMCKPLKPKSHYLDDADRLIRMIDSRPAGVSLWETPRR